MAALVRKLINWLTVKTGEGDLYEIDTALRPNGGAGLLITSFESPMPTTSNSAAATPPGPGSTRPLPARAACWAARPCYSSALTPCATSRHSAPRAMRHGTAIGRLISAMRAKVRMAHMPVSDGKLFEVKHSPGGMVDIEFAVQYLVLSQGLPPCQSCWTTSAILRCWCGPKPAACCPYQWCGQRRGRCLPAVCAILQHQSAAERGALRRRMPEDSVHRTSVHAGLALWEAVFGASQAI